MRYFFSLKTLFFIGKRLLHGVPVILGIAVVNFLLLQLAPGDAASVLAGESGGAPLDYLEQLRQHYGLNQPLAVQLLLYVKNIMSLNLGYSFRYDMPVLHLILERMGPTLLLMGSACCLSLVMGVLLGVLAAGGVNTWRDRIISLLAIIAHATPLFWMGLMLILLFSVKLEWLPIAGMEDVVAFHQGWARIRDIGWHLILPSLTLSLFHMATYARMMRASILEERDKDYVLTARAKGLREGKITCHHILRNALLPVITMAGIQVGALLGGSVVIEAVFAWPGLGQLAFQALFSRDFNLLLGIFFLSACLVVIINLLVDLIYMGLDPRMKIE